MLRRLKARIGKLGSIIEDVAFIDGCSGRSVLPILSTHRCTDSAVLGYVLLSVLIFKIAQILIRMRGLKVSDVGLLLARQQLLSVLVALGDSTALVIAACVLWHAR